MQPVNLLPDPRELRRERLRASRLRLLLGGVLIWILLLGGVSAGQYYFRQTLEEQLTEVQQQVAALEPVAQRVTEHQQLVATQQQLRQLVETNTVRQMSEPLDLLASLTPPEIVVSSMRLDGDQVDLSCQSTTLPAIGQFQTNLLQAERLVDVSVGAISLTGQEYYSFGVSFRYQGGGQP